MIASSLEGVEGLGPRRRERLMVQFGSLDALRHATLDELEAMSWLPSEVAHNIYDHLQAPGQPRPSKGGAHDE